MSHDRYTTRLHVFRRNSRRAPTLCGSFGEFDYYYFLKRFGGTRIVMTRHVIGSRYRVTLQDNDYYYYRRRLRSGCCCRRCCCCCCCRTRVLLRKYVICVYVFFCVSRRVRVVITHHARLRDDDDDDNITCTPKAREYVGFVAMSLFIGRSLVGAGVRFRRQTSVFLTPVPSVVPHVMYANNRYTCKSERLR